MEMPDYSYPRDPKSGDPKWKDVTNECGELVNELLTKAEKLFGPRASTLPVRITEFSEGPRICVNNGVAYIRLGPGVGPGGSAEKERQLRHQVGLEVGHLVLSLPDQAAVTPSEEGLTAYFAVVEGGWSPQDDSTQRNYKKAYEMVEKLMTAHPDLIRELRQRPRSVRSISADEIRKNCKDFSDDDIGFLVSEWKA